jgi:hypothetical protein
MHLSMSYLEESLTRNVSGELLGNTQLIRGREGNIPFKPLQFWEMSVYYEYCWH